MAQFVELIGSIRDGEAIPRLDAELTELMDAICTHQAAGTMTLKLKITPDKLDNFRVVGVRVDYQVETKPPTEKAGTSTFYVLENGELTRNNPRQMALEMEVNRVNG